MTNWEWFGLVKSETSLQGSGADLCRHHEPGLITWIIYKGRRLVQLRSKSSFAQGWCYWALAGGYSSSSFCEETESGLQADTSPPVAAWGRQTCDNASSNDVATITSSSAVVVNLDTATPKQCFDKFFPLVFFFLFFFFFGQCSFTMINCDIISPETEWFDFCEAMHISFLLLGWGAIGLETVGILRLDSACLCRGSFYCENSCVKRPQTVA